MMRTSSSAQRSKRWSFRLAIFLAVVVALVLIRVSVVIASHGAFGVFVASGESTAGLGAGTVKLAWNETTTPQLRMVIGPLHPNESAEFASNLVNIGSVALSAIQIGLTSSGTGTPSDGFQVAIDSCTMPWVSQGSTFTCDGGVETALSPERPVEGLISVLQSESFEPRGIDYLRFTYRLSDSAPETSEGSSGTISITAMGTQRAGREQ